MKEPIQQIGDEVSVVIYDSPLPPRYFKFTKKFIRTLFFVVPIFFGLLIFLLLFWSTGFQIKNAPLPNLPDINLGSDSKVGQLENEIKSLKESNDILKLKLANQSSGGIQEDPFLVAVKKPYGMQNFISERRVSLDQFEFVHDNQKTNLKFQIISTRTETKVTGHVIVLMISENGLMAYPFEANASLNQGIKFSSGEPFSVSRLRPTNAEFPIRANGESVKFMIYIFTREGDLLLTQETELYKIGK